MKKDKKTKKKSSIVIKILILILIAILAYGGIITYKAIKIGGGLQGFVAVALGHDENTVNNLKPYRCLLIGRSQNLTDTIIVAQYNPKTQEASMLSIPRDTFTGTNPVTASSWYKINALYQQSPQKLLDAVNKLTGLDIDKYVMIDTKALIKVVDLIGGVYFDVPIDMDYDDSSQDLYIHLSAGYQLLDGNKAEQLVRFRKNNNYTGYPKEYGSDDYGRMRTQREFLIAALKQSISAKNIFKMGEFLDVLNEYVETNVDFNEVKDYLPYIININPDNIKTGYVPGGSRMPGSLWFFFPDEEGLEQLVQELFYGEPSLEEREANSKYKVEILYVKSKESTKDEILNELTKKGFNVSTKELTSSPVSMILNRKNLNEEELEKIIRYTEGLEVQKADDTGDAHVSIILGEN